MISTGSQAGSKKNSFTHGSVCWRSFMPTTALTSLGKIVCSDLTGEGWGGVSLRVYTQGKNPSEGFSSQKQWPKADASCSISEDNWQMPCFPAWEKKEVLSFSTDCTLYCKLIWFFPQKGDFYWPWERSVTRWTWIWGDHLGNWESPGNGFSLFSIYKLTPAPFSSLLLRWSSSTLLLLLKLRDYISVFLGIIKNA